MVFAYFFFAFTLFRSCRLVSIEGDRRLEGSSAKHANVYLRSRRIYGGSYRVNYVVYVWTGRICWGVGVRYIYLISKILNVYGGLYTYINTLTHMVTYSVSQSKFLLDICDFSSQLAKFLLDICDFSSQLAL